MLHNATDLRAGPVQARDGEIGKMKEVYFDDREWRVRWFVVDTGGWLGGRKVLIPPAAVYASRSGERAIAVELSRDQVKDSPGIEADQPVSRRYEDAHARYYGVPLYWAPAEAAGLSTAERAERRARKVEEGKRQAAESHLRSSDQVIGYAIRAADGRIGHVEDLRLDDSDWSVADLVVDTGGWLPGRKVLVPPSAIADIDWNSREVRLRMSRDELKHACPAT